MGFRAEDLGLKAYRSFSLVSSGVSSPSKESSHPARPLSRQSSVNSVSEPASLPVPLKPKKKWFGAVVEEGYAKQYKKRDSYERKYSTIQIVKQKRVRANAQQGGKGLLESNSSLKSKQFGQIRKLGDGQKIAAVKPRPATVAQQLLAKAKEGKRLQQIQRKQKTTFTSEVKSLEKVPLRSRSGRIVKPKKFDYEDFISPKKKSIKVTVKTNDIEPPVAQKRPRDGLEALPAAKKQWTSVQLDVDVNRDLGSPNESGSQFFFLL